MSEHFSEKDHVYDSTSSHPHANMGGKSKLFGTKSGGSDEKNIQLEHLESVNSNKPKVSKKTKFRRHWKRFWCCYLVGFVVLSAIFLPLL